MAYEHLSTTMTGFFDDRALFASLREMALPEIVAAARERDHEIRLWSAGCATGEEAYSLAILVAEILGVELERFTVRIFATDLDATAITYARRGIYPAAALNALPADLVQRYFTPLDGGYEVSRRLRGLVVFAEHGLGQHPPVSHIDLCLCRDVLIYSAPDMQQRVLRLFAFALRDRGYLGLDQVELPGALAEFFVPAHPQLPIYRRQGARLLVPAVRIQDTRSLRLAHNRAGSRALSPPAALGSAAHRRRADDEAALLRALPWGVIVVDRQYDIQTINMAARRLLGIYGPALGEDLVHLTARLPAPGLRAAIDAVRDGAAERDLLLAMETAQGEQRYLQLLCRRYTHPGEAGVQGPATEQGTVLILAADVTALEGTWRAQEEDRAWEVTALREARARLEERVRWLEATNEQLSAANAELCSANEAFLLGNEHLQAALEEVETLNAEMQAAIEELHTANDELEARSLEMQMLAAEREEQRQRSAAERSRLAAALLSMGEAMHQTGTVVLTLAAVERLFGTVGADFVPQDKTG